MQIMIETVIRNDAAKSFMTTERIDMRGKQSVMFRG